MSRHLQPPLARTASEEVCYRQDQEIDPPKAEGLCYPPLPWSVRLLQHTIESDVLTGATSLHVMFQEAKVVERFFIIAICTLSALNVHGSRLQSTYHASFRCSIVTTLGEISWGSSKAQGSIHSCHRHKQRCSKQRLSDPISVPSCHRRLL